MTQKEIERVKALHELMQNNSFYSFNCCACMLMARPADCKGCPVYSAGE